MILSMFEGSHAASLRLRSGERCGDSFDTIGIVAHAANGCMTLLFVGSPLANPRSLPKAALRLPPAGIALAVVFNRSDEHSTVAARFTVEACAACTGFYSV